MIFSQKTLYGLRAIFEIARHSHQGPVTLAHIARQQAIPVKFLGGIMAELRRGRFVTARRGKIGGYSLTRDPARLTIGEVIAFISGDLRPVPCLGGERPARKCPLKGRCAFLPFWKRLNEAISGVVDTTTFQDLVEQEKRGQQVINYAI